jgi:integrase
VSGCGCPTAPSAPTRPTRPAPRPKSAVCRSTSTKLWTPTSTPPADAITLADWVALWEPGHLAGPAKWAAYRSHLRIHILPAFGNTPLNQISRHAVKLFVKQLKCLLADASVASVMTLFGLLMREAVADRRIPFNPCQWVRVVTRPAAERPHATAAQVNKIVARIVRPTDQLLVNAAAYTGMRWGELAGLARANTHLDDGLIRVHPDVGALHEVGGQLFLGPPKTRDSARDIHIPPFLAAKLRALLDSHDHDLVFTGARGTLLRRSSMSRRVFNPAVTGNPSTGQAPVISGMHFHDLRHTHKTWLIEDDIPEIAQAKRLGHRLPGIRGIYSHVNPAMIQRIVDALERRWISTQADRAGRQAA